MTYSELTAQERVIIQDFKHLARRWPKSLWVYASGTTLAVLKTGPDGKPVEDRNGSIDQSYIVDEIDIPSDGGGW